MRFSLTSISIIALSSLLVANVLTEYAADVLPPRVWVLLVTLLAVLLVWIEARATAAGRHAYGQSGWLRHTAAFCWDVIRGAHSFMWAVFIEVLDFITELCTYLFGWCCFVIFLFFAFSAEVPSVCLYVLVFLSPGVLVYLLLIIFAYDGIGYLLKQVLGSFFVSFGLYLLVGFLRVGGSEIMSGVFTVERLLGYVPLAVAVFVYSLYAMEPEPERQPVPPQRPVYSRTFPTRKRF